jgi:dual-specificity kinase
VRMYAMFETIHNGQKHFCMGFERLGRSLFDYIKKNDYHGFTLTQTRSFAYQLLKAIAFCHSISLVHTDLKPENILLVRNDYTITPVSTHALR